MTVKTRFGEMEINENDIIKFPNGIYGFEDTKEYVILKMEKDSPFIWMQSITDDDLAFVLIDPRVFTKDYILDVSEEDLKIIEMDDEKDIADYTIVTIPDTVEDMTANLQGPILINVKKQLGVQGISLRNDYTVKHHILDRKDED